jgi:group I intron endonuclease
MADVNDSTTTKYENGKIYKLVNSCNNDIYIGSTITPLWQRFNQHKCNSKNPEKTSKLYCMMREVGADHFSIVLIEAYSCETERELHEREDFFIDTLKSSLNMFSAIRIADPLKHKEWLSAYTSTPEFKAQKAIKDRKYRDKNKESIAARKKKWVEDNRASVREKHKLYYIENKVTIQAQNKSNRLVHKEDLDAKKRVNVQCDVCKKDIRQDGIPRHNRSVTHQRNIAIAIEDI